MGYNPTVNYQKTPPAKNGSNQVRPDFRQRGMVVRQGREFATVSRGRSR